ncbi:hypothetical protein Mapa_007012 [Marchantia paleacea]|nr:hypothetical protein Mapa_007012 [Marchantia paleacea]
MGRERIAKVQLLLGIYKARCNIVFKLDASLRSSMLCNPVTVAGTGISPLTFTTDVKSALPRTREGRVLAMMGRRFGTHTGGRLGRMIAAPLLVLNLMLSIIVLAMAGWMLNREITLGSFGGNHVTPWLSIFSLIAGMTSLAAIMAGLHHLRLWKPDTGAAAQATSWISWFFLVLAFCLAWKEIRVGGRGTRHKVLEAFVIILTVTKFLYTISLYIVEKATNTTTGPKPEIPPATTGTTTMPDAPVAASAV